MILVDKQRTTQLCSTGRHFMVASLALDTTVVSLINLSKWNSPKEALLALVNMFGNTFYLVTYTATHIFKYCFV